MHNTIYFIQKISFIYKGDKKMKLQHNIRVKGNSNAVDIISDAMKLIENFSIYEEDNLMDRGNELDDIASKILADNNCTGPYIDIIRIVKQDDFLIQAAYLEDSIKALLLVDEHKKIYKANTHRLIIISKFVYDRYFLEKSRFIIAHEYAYFILFGNGISRFAHKYQSTNKSNIRENQANTLARCLLMPRLKVHELIKSMCSSDDDITSDKLIGMVAKTFGVTPKVANQRLDELGYIGITGGKGRGEAAS